jgi:hypothetical protein
MRELVACWLVVFKWEGFCDGASIAMWRQGNKQSIKQALEQFS